MMGFRRLGLLSKEILYSSSQRYNISRQAGRLHSFAVRDSTIRLDAVSSLLPSSLKNAATFQNCRLIATYHLDESRRAASFRASTVLPAVVFVLDAETHATCASASFDYKLLIYAATDNSFLRRHS